MHAGVCVCIGWFMHGGFSLGSCLPICGAVLLVGRSGKVGVARGAGQGGARQRASARSGATWRVSTGRVSKVVGRTCVALGPRAAAQQLGACPLWL